MTDMGEMSMVPLMIEAFRKDAPNCRLIFLDLWGDELREGFDVWMQGSLNQRRYLQYVNIAGQQRDSNGWAVTELPFR